MNACMCACMYVCMYVILVFRPIWLWLWLCLSVSFCPISLGSLVFCLWCVCWFFGWFHLFLYLVFCFINSWLLLLLFLSFSCSLLVNHFEWFDVCHVFRLSNISRVKSIGIRLEFNVCTILNAIHSNVAFVAMLTENKQFQLKH